MSCRCTQFARTFRALSAFLMPACASRTSYAVPPTAQSRKMQESRRARVRAGTDSVHMPSHHAIYFAFFTLSLYPSTPAALSGKLKKSATKST
eukprot:6195669-Pleurochrysis_carterae.AAC.2